MPRSSKRAICANKTIKYGTVPSFFKWTSLKDRRRDRPKISIPQQLLQTQRYRWAAFRPPEEE
ncbi:hypothetical protein T09_10924, partial [Trichinella sp. T9]